MIKSLAVISLLGASVQGAQLGGAGDGIGGLLQGQTRNSGNLNYYIGGGNVNSWGSNVYDGSNNLVGGGGDSEANIIENLPQVRWGTDHFACPSKQETAAIGLTCGKLPQLAEQNKRRGLLKETPVDIRCDFNTCFQRDSKQGSPWGLMHIVNPTKYKSNLRNNAYPFGYPNYSGDHAGINAFGDLSDGVYPSCDQYPYSIQGSCIQGGDCIASADDVAEQSNMPYGFGGWRDYTRGVFPDCDNPTTGSKYNQCKQFHPDESTFFKDGGSSTDDDERYTHYHFRGSWGHYRGSSPVGGTPANPPSQPFGSPAPTTYPHSVDAGWGSDAGPLGGWGPCYGHTPHKAMCAVETEDGFEPLEDWLNTQGASLTTISSGTDSMDLWKKGNLRITYNRHAQVSNGLGEVVGCSCRALPTHSHQAERRRLSWAPHQETELECPNLVVNFKCRELVYACIHCETGKGQATPKVDGRRRRNILEGAIELHEQRRALAYAAHADRRKEAHVHDIDVGPFTDGSQDGPCRSRCPTTNDLKSVGMGTGTSTFPGSGEVIYDNIDNSDGDPQPPGGPYSDGTLANNGAAFPSNADSLLNFEYHGCSALNEAGADNWQTCLIGQSDGAHGC